MASSHESIVKILIASDIHAGYGENKPIISQDTFHTLDEVLKKAEEKKVHFILMAGDLFHENHPTRETHLKVVRSLRKYCLGVKKPDIQFLSDPAINFQHSQFGNVNFQDPNLKVAMPIFTIHGNHDDLSGKGLTALDVLHEAGLVNLFGKFSDVDEIHVSPLLVTRGNTKIAIYGIGSQRDDRLSRAFSKGRVKFNRPVEDPNSWFSILVLHQNRPPRSKIRSTKAHLSFKSIPSWFDLVIWGHEHECRIEPEIKYPNPADDDRSKSFYIIQPGSTVATSLTIEEAAQKHIGVLHIREKEFKMNKIELESTRQVLIDELILEDSEPNVKISRSTVRPDKLPMPDEPLITQHVEMMLRNAEEKRKPLQPKPPRIRLKVVYSGKWLDLPPINGRKFGQKFEGRVANPNEMIFVRVMKENNNKAKNVGENLSQVLGTRMDDVCSVEEMVNKYFTKCDFKNRLNVLSEIAMGKQLQEYTNTELNTQYKYTAADKSMSEYIKQQLADLTDKVNEKVNSRVDQDSTEDTMERQIMNAIFMAKKERLALNKTNTTTTSAAGGDESNVAMNETADTLFHERGYDPANIVTSTPRASQEREILWSESMQQPLVASDESQQGGAGGGGGSGAMELDATEFDFSP